MSTGKCLSDFIQKLVEELGEKSFVSHCCIAQEGEDVLDCISVVTIELFDDLPGFSASVRLTP